MGAWRAGRGGERSALHAQRPPLPVGSAEWWSALFATLDGLIPGSCWRKEEEDGLNQMLRRVLSQRPSPGEGGRDDNGTTLAGALLPRSIWSGIDPASWELLSSLCEAVRTIRTDVDTNYTSTEFLYSFRRCRLTIDPKAQYALYVRV